MELRLVRTMWGILDFRNPEPETWDKIFAKLKAEGYSAIEASIGAFDVFASNPTLAVDLLKKNGLSLIRQVHTTGYPMASRSIAEHVKSLRFFATKAREQGAIFVNSHSGYDGWSAAEAKEFFDAACGVETEVGIPIIHETHRRRALYSPWSTRDVIASCPKIRYTCDLSHWACVCERILSDPADLPDGGGEGVDGSGLASLAGIMEAVTARCGLIHARVGYAEGPQVPDPSAPEYADELEAHERWWTMVWRAAARRGDEAVYLEPEHGPAPYLHTLPHTNVPVADLYKVNSWLGARQAERFLAWRAAGSV